MSGDSCSICSELTLNECLFCDNCLSSKYGDLCRLVSKKRLPDTNYYEFTVKRVIDDAEETILVDYPSYLYKRLSKNLEEDRVAYFKFEFT